MLWTLLLVLGGLFAAFIWLMLLVDLWDRIAGLVTRLTARRPTGH